MLMTEHNKVSNPLEAYNQFGAFTYTREHCSQSVWSNGWGMAYVQSFYKTI